jgi:hypothetical protein
MTSSPNLTAAWPVSPQRDATMAGHGTCSPGPAHSAPGVPGPLSQAEEARIARTSDASRSGTSSAQRRTLRSWPLLLLAAPAAVAVWSGWIGIGDMTGFGEMHPLPGIWDSLHINTAVTLPIGVEAYAAFALRAPECWSG